MKIFYFKNLCYGIKPSLTPSLTPVTSESGCFISHLLLLTPTGAWLLAVIERVNSLRTANRCFKDIIIDLSINQSKIPCIDCKKENMINNTCYLLNTTSGTYDNAEAQCRSSGGILAIIKNEETNSKIMDFVKKIGTLVWIGIKYDSNRGKFIYVNGTEELNSKYTKWYSGYPKYLSSYYYCVYLNTDGYWYNYPCSYAHPYVCQYEVKPCNTRNITVAEGAEFDKCHEDSTISVGFNVSITCQEGYRLIGSSQVTCLSTGEWTEMPKCLKTCLPPPSFPNANITFVKDFYDVGSSASYICDEGYFSTTNPTKSHFTITCSSRSQWTPPGSGCSLIKTYQVKNIEVMPKSTVKLKCDVYLTSLEHSRKGGEYFWSKDSNPLLTTRSGYKMDSQGALIIYDNSSKSIEGYYMCFLKGNSVVPGNTIYDLKYTKSQCNDSSTDVKTYYQYLVGTSALLHCPHSSSHTRFQWFKDGKEFPLNQGHGLYPEGSLFIRHLKLSHEGNYTCQMTEKESFCSKSITVELDVLPSPENICGKIEQSSNHPWTVSLWRKEEIAPFCYGVLIHERWVITTAQCLSGLYRKRKLDVFVRFGKNPIMDLSSEESNDNDVVDIPIIKVKVHPQFSKHVYANDIGLVKLKQPVQYSETIQPICVSEIDFTLKTSCGSLPPISGIASGWGSLDRDEVQKISLREENMTFVPHSTCFPSDSHYSDQVLCCKTTPGTKETFASDSGSPLEVVWKDRVYLLGIYSRGLRTTGLGEHDYFTKISSYIPWFTSSMGKE